VSIETPEELDRLRAAGRVVAEAIRAMRAATRPGVSTRELDEIAARVFRRTGARSGPQLDYGFPGTCCISVNDEAVHGIPGRRRIRRGDLVKLDVTAELDGFYADACVTVAVDGAHPSSRRLAAASRTALNQALRVARAGVPINHVGRTIEASVQAAGYGVCRELMGHGIGRRIHEAPNIPSHDARGYDQPLTAGLVITIEPIIAAGGGATIESADGWTLRTRDGSRSAHAEHSLVITDGAPLVLTA
jgi:methionyl aminopeptidase